MNKNEKGFTLIELLVTIVLMLSILGIAIISFISLSDRKKAQAWNQVKEQVETAAIEYFNSNEYMFEGLTDNGPSGSISVKTLVENDYINKVVNPKTGKSIPTCAYVEVKKEGSRYIATFDENGIEKASENTCDFDASVNVSEPDGPEFTLDSTCNWNNGSDNADGLNHNSTWCYQYGITPRITELRANKDDVTVGYCVADSPMCNPEQYHNLYNGNEILGFLDEEAGGGKYITVVINNGKGISMRTSRVYGIDRAKPSGDITISSLTKNYNSYNSKIDLSVSDSDSRGIASSGIASVQYLNNDEDYEEVFDENIGVSNWSKTLSENLTGSKLNGVNVVKSIIVKDAVGNTFTKSANYKVYQECSQTRDGTTSEKTGKCDCDTNKYAVTTETNLIDSYTGNSCGRTTSVDNRACTPECSAVCPTITFSGTKRNGYYVGDKVDITITPKNNNDSWEWFSNKANTTTYTSWGEMTGTKTVDISGEGKRRIKVIVTNSAGNSKTCYSNEIIIDRTAPSCPTFSYSGTLGENGWYRSGVDVRVTPASSDTVAWKWYTNEMVGSFDSWHLWSDNNQGTLTKVLEADGKRRGRAVVRDAAGNERLCTTATFYIDHTPPTMTINYGPNREQCGSQNSIRTKYTVKDATSGLAVVKDYYGYDKNIPPANASYWRNRSITVGADSYSHDHNWGPTCTTKGTPGSGTCYRLKYYLKDKAGNERKGNTESCATFYWR